MRTKRREDVSPTASGYAGVTKQVVLGPRDGSDEIVLRYFTVDPGGATPYHTHDFPHLVKVEAGQGVAVDAEGVENPVSAGHYVFVAPNEMHNFKNTGAQSLEFICIVPGRGEPPASD